MEIVYKESEEQNKVKQIKNRKNNSGSFIIVIGDFYMC